MYKDLGRGALMLVTTGGVWVGVAGGVAGGIVDALTSSGLTAEEAQVYAEAIRRGGTMVTVRVDDSEDPMVARLLDETPPVNLTERQKELLRGFEEIARENAERHNPRSKSWFDRMREFFTGETQ